MSTKQWRFSTSSWRFLPANNLCFRLLWDPRKEKNTPWEVYLGKMATHGAHCFQFILRIQMSKTFRINFVPLLNSCKTTIKTLFCGVAKANRIFHPLFFWTLTDQNALEDPWRRCNVFSTLKVFCEIKKIVQFVNYLSSVTEHTTLPQQNMRRMFCWGRAFFIHKST